MIYPAFAASLLLSTGQPSTPPDDPLAPIEEPHEAQSPPPTAPAAPVVAMPRDWPGVFAAIRGGQWSAASAGIFVAVSAGNQGPGASTLDHPSPWATTVAASTVQPYEGTVELGDGSRYAWKLHPPVLRAVGMQRKITLGRWFRPGYRTLRAMRRLRGTRLDPFGVAEVRRVERELVAEYRSLIPTLLTLDDTDRAVEIAGLPDMVRGYEQIKLDNVARYRARLAELLPI